MGPRGGAAELGAARRLAGRATRGHAWQPSLAGLPIVAVTAEASAFAAASRPAVEQLKVAGSHAELLHLPDHGVFGNGHGLIYEKNSDDALVPVLKWLSENTEPPKPAKEYP